MKKNIIFLVIDSLMPSRLGTGANISGLSPELNRMAKNSLFCTNAFSMGNPTEFALPGLFASSMLLDDGGYADGVANRKMTLAETLHDHGYRTGAFFPLYRPSSNGYDRGFDDFFCLYDVNVILKNFANTSSWYQKKYLAGEMTEDECRQELIRYCDIYFSDIIRYFEIWDGYLDNALVPKSLIFKNYDFKSFKRDMERERERYEANKNDYISTSLKEGSYGFVKIIEKKVDERVQKASLAWHDIRYRFNLLRNLLPAWNFSTNRRSAKDVFALALCKILQGSQRWVKYPSGGFILDSFENWIDSLNGSSPFYAYIHWVDVHEQNHYSYDVCEQTKRKNNEINLFRDALHDIKRNKDHYRGNVLFDCSIRYVDHLVERLKESLGKRDLLKNTLLVITSDHGGNIPNVPVRDNISHRINYFFDELYHIPLFFSGPDITPSEYQHLVSSIDIGPTILDMVNIAIPDSFKGRAIKFANPFRDYVMMEDQGRGPCDLQRKPIRVCVRTEKYKLVYEADPPSISAKSFVTELYDLKEDAEEYCNLAKSEKVIKLVGPLIQIAIERIEQIRNCAGNSKKYGNLEPC
jgi:arylsulfatase A-like enzyme